MKGLVSYLLWEGIPILVLIFVFGSLSVINWDYESKLLVLNQSAHEWTGVYMGPILLAVAVGWTALASLLLYFIRSSFGGTWLNGEMVAHMALITLFFIFPSLATVVLGPAAITMIQQMATMPR